MNREIFEAAKRVYLYAFPLVISELTHFGSNDTGFHHFRTFPTDEDTRIVRMNCDTLYSLAFTQLKKTPYRLHIPDTGDHYFLLPIMDAYTEIAALLSSVARRGNGGSGDYLLICEGQKVPGGYHGYQVIWLKDDLNSLPLRIETRGREDYEYVHQLQDNFTLEPLYPEKLSDVPKIEQSAAEYIQKVSAKEFFSLFAYLSAVNPIHDMAVLSDFEKLGYEPETHLFSYSALPEYMQAEMEAAAEEGFREIDHFQRAPEDIAVQNGWVTELKNVGSYGENYLTRAAVAYHGWGANLPEDSIYSSTERDFTGEPLQSGASYVLHFAPDGYPRAAIFWSLTLYGLPSQYLAKNMAGRHTINTYDLMSGRVCKNEDGSLDIYICREEPDGGKERQNWLPAPLKEERFSLTIRNYVPDAETLAGKWEPPVLRRIA